MTTKLWSTAAVVALAFSMVAGRVEEPRAQARDFAFRFRFGCGAPDTLDTFKGSFTRELPSTSITIPLSLSREQIRAISAAVETIRFFDYPTQFTGLRADADEVTTTTPSEKYRLEVRSAGRMHTVSWDDKTTPSSEEAIRLRELFQLMIGFVLERPAVKKLPANFPCS
jgi:hypothetical protein